jgi:hypothetical protein
LTDEGVHQVDLELAVPAKEAARPSLLLRIRVFFERGFQLTGEVLASIHRVVLSITGDLNTIVAGQNVLRDIRTLHPGLKGIELRLSRQSKDVLLVHFHNRIRDQRTAYQPV